MAVASPSFPAASLEDDTRIWSLEHYFETRKTSYWSCRKKLIAASHILWFSLIHLLQTQTFGVLVNSFSGYTTPMNAFMKDYIFLGIIPASAARNYSYQGFKSNGHTIQFRNCDRNPNSLFAFMPNHNLQIPSGYHPNLYHERAGVAVNWRSKAIPITHPDRMMSNEFFFLTELHLGGCGCYTSSNRWTKYGFHATAIGVR